MFARARYGATVLALFFVACLSDPVGPGILTVRVIGASSDTLWIGAPGEPLPRSVRLIVTDDAGHPVAAAALTWESSGAGSVVAGASSLTDASGQATGTWRLGTNASEEQRLRITVQTQHHGTEITLRARAIPYVVSALRVVADSPAVLRVGDTLQLQVDAIDPHGNVFPAPDLLTSLSDSALATASGARVIGGPRRGYGRVLMGSHGVSTSLPVHVTQVVAAIVPARDTLVFSSLGAALGVAYQVRDDRGRPVFDTTAALAVSDTSVVRLEGTSIRSLAPGEAMLALALNPARATVPLTVEQRIASLRLVRDTIRFDALFDTTRLQPVAKDSLGFDVRHPVLQAQVGNAQIAEVANSVLRSVAPGLTVVTLSDPQTGISTSAPVVVHQFVRAIEATATTFDALGDTATAVVVARDRLGSPVVNAQLAYSVSDQNVAEVAPSGQLRALRPGLTTLTIIDVETGVAIGADVTVYQHVVSFDLDVDSARFDALFDASRVSPAAFDRLGAEIQDIAARTSYASTDTLVVRVAADGALQSVGNGDALVIARSNDGPSDTVRVTVAQRVAQVQIERDTLLFQALQAEQEVTGRALDRLGTPVAGAELVYRVEDPSIALVDESGIVRAINNGSTQLTAEAGGVAVPVSVVVSQRAVRVEVPTDTIRLDALADTAVITGQARDSLGSVVAGNVTGVTIGDTAIAVQLDSTRLRTVRNGITPVSFSVAGVVDTVMVQVQQVSTSLTATLTDTRPILSLPGGAPLAVECHSYDANGFAVSGAPSLASTARSTVTGGSCADLRVARSGYDTLVFTSGTAQASVPVLIAVAAVPDLPRGAAISADSVPAPSGPWAPSVTRGSNGGLAVYYAAFSSKPDSSGRTRGDLHRLDWLGGNQFRYDSIAIKHDDNICSPQGQGIENTVVVPRAEGGGWRMIYAAGSNKCYGWQVFSATSTDGRIWVKEPGIRLTNGGVDSTFPPPWPAGEGMVVDQLPTGEWRMIVSTFEHITPPEVSKWQITEWRSADQLQWQYIGPVLTTRDMPTGWQGSVYSPTIREIAPGLWRMLFTADGRGTPGTRSAIWSAVSRDMSTWQLEGEVVGGQGSNIYYAALLGDRIVFIRNDGGASYLATAALNMP